MTDDKRKESIKKVVAAYQILSDIHIATGQVLTAGDNVCDQKMLLDLIEDFQTVIGSHIKDIDNIARVDGFKIIESDLVEGKLAMITHWDRVINYMEETLDLKDN
ncbi:hypothetical protein [Dolichospermum circinale]|jgi:hypothetical protein|uniref:hypothetical protein n=1 Tax=Dolichospermum circinale TaxID=109265 RepID=UPI00232D5EDD|nr:hypothetical protein [Dolichospermum circinale]MDB9450540.1 hypothetical protein [Dolichospermum circinale CS-547]